MCSVLPMGHLRAVNSHVLLEVSKMLVGCNPGACSRPANLTWVLCVLIQHPYEEPTLLLPSVAFLNLPGRKPGRAH